MLQEQRDSAIHPELLMISMLELGTYQRVSIKWIRAEQGDSQYEYIMY